MSDPPHMNAVLYELAMRQLSQGAAGPAVETLRRILGSDPDDGLGHALLALALVDTKRLHAAEMEALMALRLEPDMALAHRALGKVHVARRRFQQAKLHLEQAVQLEPLNGEHLRALAGLHHLEDRPRVARELLDRALALDPDDPDVLTDVGELDLLEGNVDSAERWARQALELEAEHLDALVLMGSVLLRRGRVAEAREHAIWALRIAPTSPAALRFLASVKARESWFLGLWWRWATWMSSLGETRAIVVLLGAYVAYRAATIAIEEGPQPQIANAVTLAWLGICVYTWVSPSIFQRMIARELEAVKLSQGF